MFPCFAKWGAAPYAYAPFKEKPPCNARKPFFPFCLRRDECNGRCFINPIRLRYALCPIASPTLCNCVFPQKVLFMYQYCILRFSGQTGYFSFVRPYGCPIGGDQIAFIHIDTDTIIIGPYPVNVVRNFAKCLCLFGQGEIKRTGKITFFCFCAPNTFLLGLLLYVECEVPLLSAIKTVLPEIYLYPILYFL